MLCAQIARRLLGKILIDLRNTREEAISVAGLKCNQDNQSTISITRKDDTDLPKKRVKDETDTSKKKGKDETDTPKKKGKDETDGYSKSSLRNEDTRRTSFTGEKPIGQEEEDGKETEYRLDPK